MALELHKFEWEGTKLEMGGNVFFGSNAGSNPNRRKITLSVYCETKCCVVFLYPE
jgi:hypothetical protein